MDNLILDIMAIPLSQGLYALVDGEDYQRINKFKWFARKRKNSSLYEAVRTVWEYNKCKTILMHRQIMGVDTGLLKGKPLDIHHKGGNPLDNRKANLEFYPHDKHLRMHCLGKKRKITQK